MFRYLSIIFTFCFINTFAAISDDATEKNIAILYVFTGSDWCATCNRLDKNVLNDTSFTETMKRNKIQIEIIDFPQRKKLDPTTQQYNERIAEKYTFDGKFPTLTLVKVDAVRHKNVYFKNQNSAELSELILSELAKLNE